MGTMPLSFKCAKCEMPVPHARGDVTGGWKHESGIQQRDPRQRFGSCLGYRYYLIRSWDEITKYGNYYIGGST